MTDLWGHSRRTLAVDLAMLVVAVPAVLAAVHVLLPEPMRQALRFSHDEFSPATAYRLWTSAVVHLDAGHLVQNVAGYVAGVLPVWTIAVYRDRRREFWTTLAVLVAVVPWLAASAGYLVYRVHLGVPGVITRGFSGVAASLYGWLFVAVLGLVGTRWSRTRTVNAGLGMVLLVFLRILFLGGALEPTVAAAGAVGVALTASSVVGRWVVAEPRRAVEALLAERDLALLAGYGAVGVVVVVPELFPLDWVGSQQVTNVVSHAAGVVTGVLLAGVRESSTLGG